MKDRLINQTALAFCFLVLFLSSCQEPSSSATADKVNFIKPSKEVVLDDLKRPWSMAFLSENEALLTEKDGDLLKVDLETKEKTIIQGLPNDVSDSLLINADEYPLGTYPKGTKNFKGRYNGGLLEVVVHPDFSNNGWVYLSYSAEKEKKFTTKVIRAKLVDNALTEMQDIIVADPYTDGLFHFGGGMVFGNDGKLYISIGERLYSSGLQPEMPIAQDVTDKRGKIFRFNADGSIPDDNPDFREGAVAGLYAIGFRNVQGLALDPRTGDIWVADHGTTQGDELNRLEKGGNFGWPLKSTGKYRAGYVPPKLDRKLTDPMWSWFKTIAPTGLTFYTGTEFPNWKNNLIVPGLSGGNFWRLVIEDNKINSVEELFINRRDRTRKAVQSPNGELYILTDQPNGQVIRIKNG